VLPPCEARRSCGHHRRSKLVFANLPTGERIMADLDLSLFSRDLAGDEMVAEPSSTTIRARPGRAHAVVTALWGGPRPSVGWVEGPWRACPGHRGGNGNRCARLRSKTCRHAWPDAISGCSCPPPDGAGAIRCRIARKAGACYFTRNRHRPVLSRFRMSVVLPRTFRMRSALPLPPAGFRVSGDRITRLPCYSFRERPGRERSQRVVIQADLV
jgi:hypothetical protein